jgi:CheY-like chemotaxis protein
VITSAERQQLRERAIVGWLQANADALTRLERGEALIQRSRRVRSEVRTDTETRVLDRAHRAIQRQLRELDRLTALQAPSPTARPRILVADDRPTERVLLMHALRNDGRLHVIGDAVDGAELVGLAIVEQPDVIVLDRDLPTLPALDAARQVRRYAPRSRSVLLDDDPVAEAARVVDVVHTRSGDRNALVDLVMTITA